MTPEAKAREQIDAMLKACGWEVQNYKQFNPSAGRGTVPREVPLKLGICDYLLLVNRKAVDVIEAKKPGTLLSGVAKEPGHYGYQCLTKPMLNELEKKLRGNHATWTEDRLWDGFTVIVPQEVKGRSQARRFADLVALVRFALEQQSVLTPFAERFEQWLAKKVADGQVFTSEHMAWLSLTRDRIATSLSIEPDDLEYTPFIERGGLGRAAMVFGSNLNKLLDELSEALVA